MADKRIKMLHPDHETRDDGGVYYADSEVDAMSLSTRGYIRVDEKDSGKGAKSAPARGSGGGGSSSSSASGSTSDS